MRTSKTYFLAFLLCLIAAPAFSFHSLFLYDHSGMGAFYRTNGKGKLELRKRHGSMHKNWEIIIAGQFSDDDYTDLLFYDPKIKVGEFYTTDGTGNLNLLKKYGNWRKTWAIIVPGHFGGNDCTDLLFYDRSKGEGQFYTSDGKGGLRFLKKYDDWSKTWDLIVPGNFGGDGRTDLLFYERSAKKGEFRTWDENGDLVLLRILYDPEVVQADWDNIIPGRFGVDTTTDLLCYSQSAGKGAIYLGYGNRIQKFIQYDNWKKTWSQIVTGSFGENLSDDLFFYDRIAGHGEFYALDVAGKKIYPLGSPDKLKKGWYTVVPGHF